jgi:HSP20 family molecular chaperone IbpA
MSDYFYYFDKLFSDGTGTRLYRYFKDENDNEILVVNCAGFTKENIKLDVRNNGYKDYLYISAKPNDDMKDYVDDDLNIRFEIKSNLTKEISYEVKDGLLIITVVKKDNKPNIEIKCK